MQGKESPIEVRNRPRSPHLPPTLGTFAFVLMMGCGAGDRLQYPEAEEDIAEAPEAWLDVTFSENPECDEGAKWLFRRACGGQARHPVCLSYLEVMSVFEINPDSTICDRERTETLYTEALNRVRLLQDKAPPELRNDPRVLGLAVEMRLRMIDGFIRSALGRAEPKPGLAAAADRLRRGYEPLARWTSAHR